MAALGSCDRNRSRFLPSCSNSSIFISCSRRPEKIKRLTQHSNQTGTRRASGEIDDRQDVLANAKLGLLYDIPEELLLGAIELVERSLGYAGSPGDLLNIGFARP